MATKKAATRGVVATDDVKVAAPRRPVWVAGSGGNGGALVLADDGTMFRLNANMEWEELPPLPLPGTVTTHPA